MKNEMIDIIIPVYSSKVPLKELDKCVKSIQENTDNYNLILSTSKKSQPYNINQGLLRANSKVIAILDWDVYVSPKWLEKLSGELKDDVGIIGPKMSGEYQHWGGLSSKPEGEPKEWTTLPGGCLVFKNIGLKWDERFPSGYWADTDFCRQYKEKGYKIFIHPGVEVEHDLYSSLTNSNMKEWMAKGEEIYEEKWGDTDF